MREGGAQGEGKREEQGEECETWKSTTWKAARNRRPVRASSRSGAVPVRGVMPVIQGPAGAATGAGASAGSSRMPR